MLQAERNNMIILNGKYNSAKVFTDVIEQDAITQIITFCNQPVCEGARVRIMPDVHAGAGCTIGTTMTITDKVIPNLVGVDIGCGMETIRLKEKHIELQKLDKLIYSAIPSGFAVRKKAHRFNEKIDLTELYCYKNIDPLRAELSLGTLGGGNHFIEADKGSDGAIYIVIHSGSRHLGLRLQSTTRRKHTGVSTSSDKEVEKHLAYCEGDLFEQYIHDMKIVQEYAMLNRQAMMDEIIKGMGLHVKDQFTTIHNYIDTEKMILRKGAVSAQIGETSAYTNKYA